MGHSLQSRNTLFTLFCLLYTLLYSGTGSVDLCLWVASIKSVSASEAARLSNLSVKPCPLPAAPPQAALTALGEVMGGSVEPALAQELWGALGVQIADHIENKFSYRQFAGIAAVAERLYYGHFCRGDKGGPTARKVGLDAGQEGGVSSSYFQSEIETADFDKLLSKLEQVQVSCNPTVGRS